MLHLATTLSLFVLTFDVAKASPISSYGLAPPLSSYCWKSLASIKGGPRQEHTTVILNNKMYIISGMKPPLVVPTVEVYDIASNSWSNGVSLPLALHHINAAVFNGSIYVMGGIQGMLEWKAMPNTYKFTPEVGKWEALQNMPEARGAGVAGVHGNKIYVVGGEKEPLGAKGKQMIPVGTVSVFDVENDKWTSLPGQSLPEGREHAGGAVIGDTFYIVGGRLGRLNVRDSVFAMNLTQKNMKWVEKAKMPTARGGIGAAAVGTKIFTFGGEGNSAPNTRGVFKETEVYDTITDSWEKAASMKLPRHGMQVAAAGDAVLVPGGSAEQGSADPKDTFDMYSPGPC